MRERSERLCSECIGKDLRRMELLKEQNMLPVFGWEEHFQEERLMRAKAQRYAGITQASMGEPKKF